MKIEELRRNDIGNMGFLIRNSQEQEKVVLFQHHKIVNILMRDVFHYMWKLENPDNKMAFENNIECFKLVSVIFICLESYVNDVLKLICKAAKINYMEYKGKALNPRISEIIRIAGYGVEEKELFYKGGLFQQLKEFEEFRNIIFHSGFYEEKVFYKTLFSSNPHNCNFVDVLQALKILIEFFNCFRFIILGKDIMPQSFIDFEEKAYFEKVNKIYVKVIVPMFDFILKKHGMESELEMELSDFSFQPTSLLSPEDVMFLIRAEQQLPKIEFSGDKTNYMAECLKDLTSEIHVDREHFRLPNCEL